MTESVVVGVRVRPFNERELGLNADCCIEMNGPTTVIKDSGGKEIPFTFDESFWSHDGFVDNGTGYNEPKLGSKYADQRYVFDTFGKRVLDNAWEGFHCCLFAYGQTGSGKSYSMVGYGANKGIVPISCEEIFRRIEENDNPDKRYEVTVSMVEIYNEAVQDLLIMPEDRPKKGLEIRESKLLGVYIDGVMKRPVTTYKAIEATIDEATSHRTVGSTLMNATSSRAHTVQTIEFKQVQKVAGKDQVKVSMINLVDLAGSEKAGQTGATGDRLKEGSMINKSLSALGNVIERLAEKSQGTKKQVLIPYRDSKLTRLLQNALGGSSKTIMICALSPASSNYEETHSTLRYADRAKKIKNSAVVNENPQDRLLRELREENQKLKAMMENLTSGGAVDAQAVKDMTDQQQEIAEVEKALKEMEKSFEERVQEAREREEEQKERKRRTLLDRSNIPVLVNLNEDVQLTGRIKYQLPEGKVTKIGRACGKSGGDSDSGSEGESSDESDSSEEDNANEPDIVLQSDGTQQNQASITNINNDCWLNCSGLGAESTWINGERVADLLAKQKQKQERRASMEQSQMDEQGSSESEKPEEVAQGRRSAVIEDGAQGKSPPDPTGIKLNHCDRVVFGKSYFFFCIPAVTVPEMLIMSGQVDYSICHKEMLASRRKKEMNVQAEQVKSAGNTVMMRFLGKMKTRSTMIASPGAPTASDDDDDDEDESFDDSEGAATKIDWEAVSDELEEKIAEVEAKKAELAAKDAQLAEKDRIIADLCQRLQAAGVRPPDIPGDGVSTLPSGFQAASKPSELPSLASYLPGGELSNCIPSHGLEASGHDAFRFSALSNPSKPGAGYSGFPRPGAPSAMTFPELEDIDASRFAPKPGMSMAAAISSGFGEALSAIDRVEGALTMLAEKKKRAKKLRPSKAGQA